MTNIDFSTMSLEELEQLSAAAYKEVAIRKQREQEKDWRELIRKLDDYCKKYGEVSITGYGEDFVLTSPICVNQVGEISIEED